MPHPWFDVWLIHPEPEASAAFERRFAGLANVHVYTNRYEQLSAHDCFVTAGNAYGVMTAGIDAAIIHRFGPALMREVQEHIMERYLGEQPVGAAFILPTGDPERPYLCHAPTMRMPGPIARTSQIYTATFAALTAAHRHNVEHGGDIQTLVFPAMGTGFGQVEFDESARQMAVAYSHYLRPPARPTWDSLIARERRICYDNDRSMLTRTNVPREGVDGRTPTKGHHSDGEDRTSPSPGCRATRGRRRSRRCMAKCQATRGG